MSAEAWCARIGQIPYDEGRELQKSLAELRGAGEIPDVLLLLEHPPTCTKGRRSTPDELPMGEDWYRMQGIEVAETDRGGRVTYHGPGQLVGYPIVDLRAYGDDVHAYIRSMERVMIDSLVEWGVEAGLREGLTGVWVGERKIGSIGVHVNRGITTHGFAINVNNDLQPFEWIVPCGIEHCRVTSVCRELGSEQDAGAFMDTVSDHFSRIYGRDVVEVEPASLTSPAATGGPCCASSATASSSRGPTG